MATPAPLVIRGRKILNSTNYTRMPKGEMNKGDAGGMKTGRENDGAAQRIRTYSVILLAIT